MAAKMTYEELETRARELGKEVEEKNQLFIQYKQSKGAEPESEVDKKGLKHIEWLLKKNIDSMAYYEPPYGDLTHLNKSGLILNSVGSDVLQEIAHDFMDLLGTSSAIYEKNGDYALGIFSSGWCQFLDRASYNLCDTDNKREALDSGKWYCHESCWRDASKICIETGEQVDIECNGGINIYAVPIYAGKEVIGAINFGYGDTPKDNQKLKEIADKYKVDVNELTKYSQIYQTRPAFIIDIAKKRLVTAAKLIGEITHRKQAEQSLHESEARFKALHNASFGGITIHDKGVILDCNQGLSEITGYSMNELIGMDGLLLIAEKSRYFVMQNILSGYEKPYEAVGLRKNGEEYPIRLEARNIPYKGKTVRVVEFRDITEQKRIEEELRVSVIKHKTILEALPVGVTVSDNAGNIVESNNAAQKMLGLSREEHLKRGIKGDEWSIIREDGSPMPSDEFASVRALNEKRLVENVVMGIVKEDNEVTWISVSSTPVHLEGYGVAIAFSDITERRRTEEKYLTLFREMLDGFALHEIICDENGKPIDYKFLTVNPSFECMTGLKAADIVDKRVLEVLPDIEKYWIEIYGKVAITGEPAFFDNYSDELKKHFEVKAFRPAYGQFACIVSDITERKQMEIKQRELEATNLRLQKNESLAQMAGGIAHLFNNYLYAVSGNLELALYDLPEDSLIRERLMDAMKAARRCADVSGSMLTYLGQNFVKMESIDISKFCQKHLPNLQSSFNNNISIETNLSDRELLVRANAGQMQQVLNHLITNACESIGENKGRINLITKAIQAKDISKFHLLPVGSKPAADTYACLEITDTGGGISKEDFHKISDPFFTTKFTGRGLGLAVVSGIVKSWGGVIGVKSKVGHGSTFIVFLPMSVDNSVRQSKSQQA
ncbi:MAG: PAS domain S-box protein [Desulfamplus sp.]|nr:PAS domain S-box protein [Desulfamplus sp.]